jgi:hypothetical protein
MHAKTAVSVERPGPLSVHYVVMVQLPASPGCTQHGQQTSNPNQCAHCKRIHDLLTLNISSGPRDDTRTSSMSYRSVELAGTGAYGAKIGMLPKPASGGTSTLFWPPIFMPTIASCRPEHTPG